MKYGIKKMKGVWNKDIQKKCCILQIAPDKDQI